MTNHSGVDWNALAAHVQGNFAATGAWFVDVGFEPPIGPAPVDWNALAAEVQANFAATGRWFVGTAAPPPPPEPPPEGSHPDDSYILFSRDSAFPGLREDWLPVPLAALVDVPPLPPRSPFGDSTEVGIPARIAWKGAEAEGPDGSIFSLVGLAGGLSPALATALMDGRPLGTTGPALAEPLLSEDGRLAVELANADWNAIKNLEVFLAAAEVEAVSALAVRNIVDAQLLLGGAFNRDSVFNGTTPPVGGDPLPVQIENAKRGLLDATGVSRPFDLSLSLASDEASWNNEFRIFDSWGDDTIRILPGDHVGAEADAPGTAPVLDGSHARLTISLGAHLFGFGGWGENLVDLSAANVAEVVVRSFTSTSGGLRVDLDFPGFGAVEGGSALTADPGEAGLWRFAPVEEALAGILQFVLPEGVTAPETVALQLLSGNTVAAEITARPRRGEEGYGFEVPLLRQDAPFDGLRLLDTGVAELAALEFVAVGEVLPPENPGPGGIGNLLIAGGGRDRFEVEGLSAGLPGGPRPSGLQRGFANFAEVIREFEPGQDTVALSDRGPSGVQSTPRVVETEAGTAILNTFLAGQLAFDSPLFTPRPAPDAYSSMAGVLLEGATGLELNRDVLFLG